MFNKSAINKRLGAMIFRWAYHDGIENEAASLSDSNAEIHIECYLVPVSPAALQRNPHDLDHFKVQVHVLTPSVFSMMKVPVRTHHHQQKMFKVRVVLSTTGRYFALLSRQTTPFLRHLRLGGLEVRVFA